MKKNSFIPNLINNMRKWLGWCPRSPEQKSLQKFKAGSFTQFSILNMRPVKMGLLASAALQIVTYFYTLEAMITPLARLLESQGRYYQGSYSDLGALFSIVTAMALALFISSTIAGYLTGKVTSRLRQGFVVGVVSLFFGGLLGIPISSYYKLQYSFPTTYGGITISSLIMSLTMASFSFLFFGGLGGVVGQLLSRKKASPDISSTGAHKIEREVRP